MRIKTMKQREHLLNAIGLTLGFVVLAGGGDPRQTAIWAVGFGVPVTLGVLVPDVDVAVGKHRKTLHNLPVLAAFVAFPFVFGNLHYVWVGVAAHYLLDLFGSRRGVALLYPLTAREMSLPGGVRVDGRWALTVTLVLTTVEVAVASLAWSAGLMPLDAITAAPKGA